MQKHNTWLIFLCLINFYSLLGNDTLLVKVFSYENAINTIAHDEKGTVYASFDSGIYALDTNNGDLVLHDPSYNDAIYYVDSLIYLTQISDDSVQLQVNAIQTANLAWLTHLPPSDLQSLLTVAVDSLGYHYVATNYHIYKFRIEQSLHKILPIYSIRGIQPCKGSMYFNTYGGLFKDQALYDRLIIGGDLFLSASGELFASSGRQLLRIEGTESQVVDLGEVFPEWMETDWRNIIQIEQNQDGAWLIGTDKGLAVVQPDTILFLLPDISIEEIRPTRNGHLLATSQDMFLLHPDLTLTPFQFPPKYYNQSINQGDKLLLATDSGLYQFSPHSPEVRPVLTKTSKGALIKVQSMVKDELGFLWCGTNDGLYQIDLSNYSHKHYLDKVEFNKRSFYRNKDTIYMGAIDGLYTWAPSDFTEPILGRQQYPSAVTSKREETERLRKLYLILLLLVATASSFLFLMRRKNNTTQAPPYEQPPSPPSAADRKALIDEFIHSNINTVTVHSLCEFLDLKKNELYALTRTLYRKTPGQLIREKRKAIVLETYKNNPETPIDELASIVGYSERHIQNILDPE